MRGARKFAKRINAINANRQARYKARIELEREEVPECEVDDNGKYFLGLRSAMITVLFSGLVHPMVINLALAFCVVSPFYLSKRFQKMGNAFH